VDSRTKNQMSPGRTHLPANFSDPNGYDPKDPRGPNLSNYQLTKKDFPLYKFGPDGKLIESQYTYNVVASSGTFSGAFQGVPDPGSSQPNKFGNTQFGSAKDDCKPYSNAGAGMDETYHVGNVHTRRVEPRNTPNFINSIFFDRQFWDGRAQNAFNGVTGDGARNPNAYLWVVDNNSLWQTRVNLPNSSLASLAVGPPLDQFEMACRGRTWKDVARKLLKRRALEVQEVHAEDSVLGAYRHSSGKGLNVTYEDLVKQAFAPRYWSAGVHPLFGKPGYDPKKGFSQAEVNFSLFFGLAIQMYGATQVSDDTKFDRSRIVQTGGGFVDQNGVLTAQELKGFRDFNDAHCIFCHTGPLFTLATNRKTYFKKTDLEEAHVDNRTMINRIGTFDGKARLVDTGFLNNGAVPSENDPGVGNNDDAGHPLSNGPEYLASLALRDDLIYQPLPTVQACEIGFDASGYFTSEEFGGQVLPDETEGCENLAWAVVPNPQVAAAAIARGEAETQLALPGHQFKVPQMYNIELTGPYMHNGGFSTLDQVLDQYLVQVGNFHPGNSPNHVNPDMHKGLIFDATVDREALKAFLATLTDDRVKYERAPFDHPQILVSNGHPGNEAATQGTAGDPGQARDEVLVVPAVGRNGRPADYPLETFEALLPE
jgi:cytochrome c peroxidase